MDKERKIGIQYSLKSVDNGMAVLIKATLIRYPSGGHGRCYLAVSTRHKTYVKSRMQAIGERVYDQVWRHAGIATRECTIEDLESMYHGGTLV